MRGHIQAINGDVGEQAPDSEENPRGDKCARRAASLSGNIEIRDVDGRFYFQTATKEADHGMLLKRPEPVPV